MKHQTSLLIVSVTLACCGVSAFGQSPPQRTTSDPSVITSSWDDLTAGIQNTAQWRSRRSVLKRRYLELIRDQYKPKKPRLDRRVDQH